MKKVKVKLVCKECGSDDLYFTGYMLWDVKKQDYIMDEIHTTHCGDCHFTRNGDVKEVTIKVGGKL